MSLVIKNKTENNKIYAGQLISGNSNYTIVNLVEQKAFANSDLLINDLTLGIPEAALENSANPGQEITGSEAVTLLNSSHVVIDEQADLPPFARPDFRTKNDATADKVTILADEAKTIDYAMATELYVSGGTLIIKGAKFGDYITAEVADTIPVIPEPYREALCEDWPTVASYVTKTWVETDESDICIHTIDTRPLNAKITAGLSLRITYHATSEASTREVLVNYDLTAKLV